MSVTFQIDTNFETGIKHIAAGHTNYVSYDIDALIDRGGIYRIETVACVVTYRVPHGYKTDYEWINKQYEGNGDVYQLFEKAEELAINELKKMDE